MIEVHHGLFVGSQSDLESGIFEPDSWAIVHACKEPHHREALGYKGRAADKTHPEYLLARRGHRLILNLVDVEDPRWIAPEIMDAAVTFIHENLTADRSVLVHCNQGCSRSPSIAMLYIAMHTTRLPRSSYDQAKDVFVEIYPPFAPAGGMDGFLRDRWLSWGEAEGAGTVGVAP